MQQGKSQDWIDLKRDHQTGLETIQAHLSGHAYDPHWHDSYLIGITQQGVQHFNCRGQKQISRPGTSFLLEPGEIHDGEAPNPDGFTYCSLSLTPEWLQQQMAHLFDNAPDKFEMAVTSTLSQDQLLAASISSAFTALHFREPQIVQDGCVDHMIEHITCRFSWRVQQQKQGDVRQLAHQSQDYLHAHLNRDVGLHEMAEALSVDRFRLSRVFKSTFGITPHAYLIQLRLTRARALLSQGKSPAEVSSELCFSDQSHMGRWFRRCYQMTPTYYQQRTNLPDIS